NSILRPASVLFFCLSSVEMPCSIWMPPWASGPVLTVSRPILNGAPWAIAGMPMVAAAVPAAVAARNLRRLRRIGITHPSWFARRRAVSSPARRRREPTPSSARVFHDIKPGIVVGAIDNAVAIDEHVGGLNDAGAVRSVVDQPLRG